MESKENNIGIVIFLIALVVVGALYFTRTTPTRPPLALSFRASLISGKVLIVTNTSSSHILECTMRASNPKSNQSITYSFRINPNAVCEIGMLEANWIFEPRESVEVHATGYLLPVTCTVP